VLLAPGRIAMARRAGSPAWLRAGIAVLVATPSQRRAPCAVAASSDRPRCSAAFLAAARYGDEAQLLRSLQEEPPSCVDGHMQTPLHLAAEENQLLAARHLLAFGALMDRDELGRAPLHSAALAGLTNMTALLLDSGAYIELRDYADRTPLHYAARLSHVDLVDLLLDRYAEFDALDGDLRTPLHHTCRSDVNLNATRTLIERGADLAKQDVIGFTPLHFACFEGELHTSEYLLDKGADVYALDAGGWNPLVHAAANDNFELIESVIIRILQPKTFELPDPSNFEHQDIESAVLGMPAWALACVLTVVCSMLVICPAFVRMLRFDQVRKPYIVRDADHTIAQFIDEVCKDVLHAKGVESKMVMEWDRMPAETLADLHRVRN